MFLPSERSRHSSPNNVVIAGMVYQGRRLSIRIVLRVLRFLVFTGIEVEKDGLISEIELLENDGSFPGGIDKDKRETNEGETDKTYQPVGPVFTE